MDDFCICAVEDDPDEDEALRNNLHAPDCPMYDADVDPPPLRMYKAEKQQGQFVGWPSWFVLRKGHRWEGIATCQGVYGERNAKMLVAALNATV